MERDLAFSATAEKYQECCDLIKKLTDWIKYIEGQKDIPLRIADSKLTRIRTAVSALERKKEKLTDEFYELSRLARTANSLDGLKAVDRKIRRLAGMQLDDEYSEVMARIQENIRKAIEDIENLPRNIDDLAKYISKISVRTNTYCWQAIKACAMTEQTRLEKKQQEWVTKYVIAAERGYEGMSPAACEEWLTNTKDIPEYLSNAVRTRYEKIRVVVEGRLHKGRVDKLLAMYDGLTDDEKRSFKRLLVGR